MSRTTMYFSLLAAVMLVGAWAPAHASVYRWVDKHGVVHYTDQWRPGATRITTVTGTAATAGSTSPGTAAEDQQADRMIQHAATERAVHAEEAKLRARRCKQAKVVYQRLIFARRLFKTGKDGQRHYLTDAQATAARVKARTTMNRLCGTQDGS